MLNVDEIKTRWVEVMINMGDHFKAFAIETMFFDEEVGDRGLAIVG